MTRNIVILAALLAVTGVYTWYDDYHRQAPTTPQAAPTAPALNRPAPNFTFETLDGKSHKLSDFRGKAIVLNFWAPWCAPCVEEFPQMLRLAGATKQETAFLFLSVDEDKTRIKAFLQKYVPGKIPENVLIGTDKDMEISQKIFQTFALPETYLISPDFNVGQKIIGADVIWDGADMRQKINLLSRTK